MNPLLAYLLLVLLVALVARGTGLPRGRSWNVGPWLGHAFLPMLAYYPGIALCYALAPSFKDPVEPSVAANSVLVALGKPVYLSLDAADPISLLYGPATYYVPALLNLLDLDPILAAKLAGLVQGPGGVAILFLCLTQEFGFRTSVRATGWVVAILLLFQHFSYWDRPDSVLVLGTSMACGAAALRRRPLAVGLAALGAGLAISAKVHGFLYLLPLAPLFARRHGRTSLLLGGVLALVMFCLPFQVARSFSLENYLAWLGVAASHGLSPDLFVKNLSYLTLLVLPLLGGILWLDKARSSLLAESAVRRSLFLFALSAACVVVVGAKPMAGPHHLLPFAPLLGLLSCPAIKSLSRDGAASLPRARAFSLQAAYVLLIAIGLVKSQKQMLRYLWRDDARAARADLERLMDRYPSSATTMGYAGYGSIRSSFLRPLLVKRSGTNYLDTPTVVELLCAGKALPDAAVRKMRFQAFDIFFIPLGEEPFSLETAGGSGLPMFGQALPRAFTESYVRIDAGRFFSVWKAKRLL